MKDRKREVTPPPFVKETFTKPEPVLTVRQSIRETLPLATLDAVNGMPLDVKRNLLAKWEEKVFALHTEYVEAIAIRDALAMHVKTDFMKPHWVRHAAVATLHGQGARLIPCAKCGKMTEWSFGGKPQCNIFPEEIPTSEEHAVCLVDAGLKRNVTRHERDVFNLLNALGTEKKGKK